MQTDKEHMDHWDLDGEFGIDMLLPVSVLQDLADLIEKIIPVKVLLFSPDSTPYFGQGNLSPKRTDIICDILKKKQIDTFKAFKTPGGRIINIFPITHLLEPIGYLVFFHEKDEQRPSAKIPAFENLVLNVLNQLIRSNYKYLVTASLHGQVVEESYTELMNKAALLEKSEQKYRLLAENLEIEVEKKAKKIKETQTKLLQQEKMASIGQLAAGVAHEINNPMGFIGSNLNALEDYESNIITLFDLYRGLLSGLKEDMATEEGRAVVSEKLKHIDTLEKKYDIDFILEDLATLTKESIEGAQRVNKIVGDLKDFAHPGNEEMQEADINKGIESTLNVVWNEIKYKAAVIKDFGELPLLKCYPQELNQVFMNILVNAAQAIEKQGEIRIETGVDDGHVEIKISDTGVGIPEKNLTRIFDPFFTTKEVGKGTGLGMNVAYNIIKKHNGTIAINSIVGKGTTFIIRIPL